MSVLKTVTFNLVTFPSLGYQANSRKMVNYVSHNTPLILWGGGGEHFVIPKKGFNGGTLK